MKPWIEVLTVSVGRVLNAGLLLLGFVALTRMLPPDEYAWIALLTAFSSLAGLVLINPAGQWFSRHLHEWYDAGTLAAHLGHHLKYVLAASVVIGLCASVWYFMVVNSSIAMAYFIWLVIASLVYFPTASITYAAALNALGHRRSSVLTQLAVTGLGLLFAVILALWDAQAVEWLAGLALGGAVAFIGARKRVRQVLTRTPELDARELPAPRSFMFQKDFLIYAYSLAFVTTMMWLEGNGYRFILKRLWSARDLGLFLMALSVPAQLTAILESIVMQFAYPYFFRALADVEGKENIGRITSAMTGTLLPLYWIWGGCLFLIAPQFIYLVAGNVYHEAVEWVAVGVLLEVARLTGNSWSLSSQALKDYSPMKAPFAVGAMGNMLTCLLIAAIDGPAVAVAVGMVVAALLKCAFIVIRARGQLPIRISWKRLGFTAILLLSGLSLYGPLAHNQGIWISLLIVLAASGTALLFGYFHLRTARDFWLLLQQRLG